MRVAVVGAAGYVGGELLRLLRGHPEVRDCIATSRSQAGRTLGEVHPALAGGDGDGDRFVDLDPAAAARGRDVVLLCLEHGASSGIAAGVLDAGPGLVVDLAADFRIADRALHERFYGPHPAPDLVGRFRYGLADVEGERLRGASAIAAPGCFATAAQLALRPLRELPFASPPALFAVTGSSGSGAIAKATTHHPTRAHDVVAYSVFGHRHEGEILERWRSWTGRADGAVRLLTHSGPFVRGIHLTLHATLADGRALERGALHDLVTSAWSGRPFVRVVDGPPHLTHVVGTNRALVHAAQSDDGREIQVIVVLDNLIKGAGGQALQAVNLALGLPETAGLLSPAPFP